VAPPPRGRGVGRCGDLAVKAERKVDRRARRAFRVDCEHVERELAGVDALERECRDEGAGGGSDDRRLPHDLILLEQLDCHRRRLVDVEGQRQEALATEVTEAHHLIEVADRNYRRVVDDGDRRVRPGDA